MAVLYRCKAPTNRLCRCGKVARRLDELGIEYAEVRVPTRRQGREEVVALTGQDRVPVIVDGDEVVCDSHRILEYLDWSTAERAGTRGGGGSRP